MSDDVALPIAGVRVLLFALNVPGPLAAQRLRSLGATVTKIEPPSGDPLAAYSSSWYAALCEGVSVMRLDLKHPDGHGQLDALLPATDLLITSFRPSSLSRVGLDRASLAPKYPRLAQVAIVGEAGVRAEHAGHDLTYQAQAGLLAPPAMPRTLMADIAGAERATTAALALIAGQARGAGSGYMEVALEDSVRAFMAPWAHGATRADSTLGGGSPLYNLYRSSDGWIALAALERAFVAGLLSALDIDHASDHELRERLTATFATRTSDDWEQWAIARGLPIAGVR